MGPAAFGSSSELKATIVHEYAHSTIDRMLDASGNFTGWRYPQGSFLSTSQTLVTDGPLGYANEIFNAGNLHINTGYLVPNNNPLWSEWNKEFKWYYTVPRRYHSPIKMHLY